jgi:hypothetical protein
MKYIVFFPFALMILPFAYLAVFITSKTKSQRYLCAIFMIIQGACIVVLAGFSVDLSGMSWSDGSDIGHLARSYLLLIPIILFYLIQSATCVVSTIRIFSFIITLALAVLIYGLLIQGDIGDIILLGAIPILTSMPIWIRIFRYKKNENQ